MKYRIRLRRQPGHHWKLITATMMSLGLAAGFTLVTGHLTLSFALLLGMAALSTQWFCVDVPGVDDADLHWPVARKPSRIDARCARIAS